MRLMLRGTPSYTLLQLWPGNSAGVKLDVYFAFETVKKGKEWRKRGETGEGGRRRGVGGGGGGSCCCGMT